MKQLAYVRNLVLFAYKHNPILFIFPMLTTASIIFELTAMMCLIPLSQLATEPQLNSQDIIVRGLSFLGINPTIKALMLFFCGLLFLRVLTNVLSQNISFKCGKRVLSQLASGAFEKIIKESHIRDIEKKSIGHFISLAGDESYRASTLIIDLHQLLSIVLLGTLYFGLIAWYSPVVAISLFCFLGISFLLMGGAFKFAHKLGEKQIAQSKAATSIFLDSLNGLRTVRSFFAESFVVDEYRSKMITYTNTLYKIDIVNILIKFIPIALLFGGIFLAIALGVVDLQSKDKPVNFAFMFSMVLFLLRFFPIVGQGLNVLMRLVSDAKAGRDVTEVLNIVSEKKIGSASLNAPIHSIRCENLNFSYSLSNQVFNDFNFEFHAGQSYALVGPSGIGKSTLFNLLMSLIRPDSGTIYVNNRPQDDYLPTSFKNKILLVEQQSIIFNNTINNNLKFGTSYTQEEIERASHIAALDDFIETLPEKDAFYLNYQGMNISGGQRQRIGIARAVLRNPDVILLDEITSALDEETKRKVLSRILNHFKDKIVIFISHDPLINQMVDVKVDLRDHLKENHPVKDYSYG